MTRARTHREFRFNAILTALLCLGIGFFANALAEEHLTWRADLSEEQLAALDPSTRTLLGELEDVLQVRAFFTGKVKHGPVQIAKDRLVRQLAEFRSLAGDRLRVLYSDPNTSSEARLEATRYGIEPLPFQAVSGTAAVQQDVYLGVVLRYRGREAVLPFVLPQTFEYGLVSELDKLLRDELLTVGILSRDASLPIVDDALTATFREARVALGADHELRDVEGTADGALVDDEIDILLVLQPVHLHPRAAWAVDRFVRRGGRLLVAVDHVLVEASTGRTTAVDTGLEELFAAWGIEVERRHVWDAASANSITVATGTGADGRPSGMRIRYPYSLFVGPSGFDPDVPALGRLPGANLFWAHALDRREPPEALRRTDLLFSSESAYATEEIAAVEVEPALLEARAAELAASGHGERLVLAAVWSGAFPSPHVDAVPAPRDALEEALWLDDVQAARREGRELPPYPQRFTTEESAGSSEPSQVVVFGDADWLADGTTWGDENRMLLESLVEWIGLDEDYRGIRAKVPRDRSIADFVAEEREALGIHGLGGASGLESVDEFSRSEAEAQRRASRRRWLHMGAATGGSLLSVVLLGWSMRRTLGLGFRSTA